MIKVTSDEFLRIWEGKKSSQTNPIHFVGYHIADDGNVQKRIRLKGNCNNQPILFKNCIIPDIWIESFYNVKFISIQDSSFGSIVLNKCNVAETIEFISNEIGSLEISEGEVKHISIQATNKIKKLKCGVGKWGLCNVFSANQFDQKFAKIDDILFTFFASECNSRIYLSHINVSMLRIIGVNLDSRLVINECSVDNFYLAEFRNECDLSISEIIPASDKSSFVISGSDLGAATLEQLDFKKFKFVRIMRSSLSEIKYYSVNWPNVINLGSTNYREKREAYRQLKIAAEKQGDRVQSLMFERNEIVHYRNELKTTKGKFGDRFILATNFFSNNHGQSWLWAFLWIIGLVTLFHFIIQISLLGLSQAAFCWKENASKAFLLLNPVHDARIISLDIYNNFTATLIDSLSRIIIGYLIFQLVRSFRKYTRA
jgi:hypothetical protein